MDDDYVLARERKPGVRARDSRIVPLGHLAEVDPGERVRSEPELATLEALQIHDDGLGAGGHRDHDRARRRVELRWRQKAVGSAEVDGVVRVLADPAT